MQWETWLKSFPKDEQGRHYAVRPWDDAWENPELIAMSNLDFRNALLACPAGAGQKVVAALEDQSGRSDNLPMTCLNWYEAYLFCMSDNARLPTESEWNYAAAGGSEQRPFPWSRDRETIGAEYANVGPVNEVRLFDVGSFPRGMGRYGQYDLAGNAIEFVIDRCDATGNVCAKYHTDGDLDPIERNAVEAPVARGGSFRFGWASARTAFRQFVGNDLSTGRHADTGMRCARNGR